MNCSSCGQDHSTLPAAWPLGARVENIRPISYYTSNEHRAAEMPIGTIGQVVYHTDDGRPGIEFDGYPNSHTFHRPELMLQLLDTPPVDLQTEVERLRAANAGLIKAAEAAIEWFEYWADEYPRSGREVEVLLMNAVDKAKGVAD